MSMEILKNQTIYKCSYCGRISLSKGGMTVHEVNCRKNPDNWSDCFYCHYLIRESKEIEGTRGTRCKTCPQYDYWDGCMSEDECDGSLHETTFLCEKTGKKMYSKKRVYMMPKEKREAIISKCDCPFPFECEIRRKEEFDNYELKDIYD